MFLKKHVFEQDQVWSDNFGRFWVHFGSQMDPKMGKTWYQKSLKKMNGILLDLGRAPGGAHRFEERTGRAQEGRRGTPPKLLAKAKSDMNKVHGAN